MASSTKHLCEQRKEAEENRLAELSTEGCMSIRRGCLPREPQPAWEAGQLRAPGGGKAERGPRSEAAGVLHKAYRKGLSRDPCSELEQVWWDSGLQGSPRRPAPRPQDYVCQSRHHRPRSRCGCRREGDRSQHLKKPQDPMAAGREGDRGSRREGPTVALSGSGPTQCPAASTLGVPSPSQTR